MAELYMYNGTLSIENQCKSFRSGPSNLTFYYPVQDSPVCPFFLLNVIQVRFWFDHEEDFQEVREM